MPDELPLVLLASAGAILALMVVTWLVSVAIKDASIVDIIWGAGFVLVAWVAFFTGDGDDARKWLITLLASAWGLRLSTYLFIRNRGKGEDYRYQAMRRHWGPRFPLISLFTVFGLQGLLMFIISMPLQVAQLSGMPEGLTWIDYLGAALFAVGLGFEATGDFQLARFKADPANAGRVMDRGLWRYTRHPNYFGDACVWFGLWLLACDHPFGFALVISPLLMTYFLVKVTGKALLERRMKRAKPDYAAYIARTSGFFPLPPKSTS